MTAKNYPCMTESPQTILNVNDTVTSPLGQYVMTLLRGGLTVTPSGGTPKYIAVVSGAVTCALVGHHLIIYGGPTGTAQLWSSSTVVTFTVKGLDMQDDGTVDFYGTNGVDSAMLFSYNAAAALFLVREAQFTEFGQSIAELHDKLESIVTNAPRISPELLEELKQYRRQKAYDRKPPSKSGHPGPLVVDDEPTTGTGE